MLSAVHFLQINDLVFQFLINIYIFATNFLIQYQIRECSTMLYKMWNFSSIFFLFFYADLSNSRKILFYVIFDVNSGYKNYVISAKLCISCVNLRPFGLISEINWNQMIVSLFRFLHLGIFATLYRQSS